MAEHVPGAPPDLPRPLKPRGGWPYRFLTPEFVDRLCEAMEQSYFEKKAAAYLGISPVSLFNWKRQGREYLAELEDSGKPANRRDPRYLALYLLNRIERKKFEMRGRLVESIRDAAEGRPAEYLVDPKTGELARDKDGHFIKTMPALRPQPKIALSLLARLDHEYADRTRHILSGMIPTEDEEEERPTDFKIEIVASRPEPTKTNGEDRTNGEPTNGHGPDDDL